MPDSRPLDLTGLDAAIESLLIGDPMSKGARLLGLEYERLILDRKTQAAAPLSVCQDLLSSMAQEPGAELVKEGDVIKGVHAPGFDLSIEPGGQFELAAPPYPNMAGVDALVAEMTAKLDAHLEGSPYELVCLGHTPVTPVEEIELLGRARYGIMNERMMERGKLSRHMMRATAGFQITYDIADREDAGSKMALLFRLSPLLMAMTANSRMAEGKDTGYASFRHKVWWETDTMRSGVPAGCLHPETAVSGYVAYARQAHMLFLDRPEGVVPAPKCSLEDAVAQGGISRSDVDLHLTSLFPFVRLRNYIEVRCFDTVEWPLARSVLALLSGLVYCSNAFKNALACSEVLAIEDPDALRDLHLEAARIGLDAAVPNGPTFRALATDLIGFAQATLGNPACDWAKPGDLDCISRFVAG